MVKIWSICTPAWRQGNENKRGHGKETALTSLYNGQNRQNLPHMSHKYHVTDKQSFQEIWTGHLLHLGAFLHTIEAPEIFDVATMGISQHFVNLSEKSTRCFSF